MGACESRASNTKMEEEEDEKKKEAIKDVVTVGGLLLAAWGISKLFGDFGHDQRKMMKAPGSDHYIYRDYFEKDPSSYFRRLRDE